MAFVKPRLLATNWLPWWTMVTVESPNGIQGHLLCVPAEIVTNDLHTNPNTTRKASTLQFSTDSIASLSFAWAPDFNQRAAVWERTICFECFQIIRLKWRTVTQDLSLWASPCSFLCLDSLCHREHQKRQWGLSSPSSCTIPILFQRRIPRNHRPAQSTACFGFVCLTTKIKL